MMLSALEDMMQMAKTNKQNADDGEDARHWAVVYTELEKVVAYLKTYLVKGE
jgi:hypothetical protein